MTPDRPEHPAAGLLSGIACYVFWGFQPLMFIWAARLGAEPIKIVVWRTGGAFICAVLLVAASQEFRAIGRLSRRNLATLSLSGMLIGLNWSIYVWASTRHHLESASLGYFILPLMNVAAGAVLFSERASRLGILAIILAVAGVTLRCGVEGSLPWIALVLATSFCIYGIIRKHVAVSPSVGMLWEAGILLVPVTLIYLVFFGIGSDLPGSSPLQTVSLLATGPATAIPLIAFAFAARRMTLATLGFLQFVSPSIQLFIATHTGETLGPAQLCSFALIWAGVLAYAVDGAMRTRSRVRRPAIEPDLAARPAAIEACP
jgi:chloramphenicol-sensitive protein RarD